MLTIHPFFHTHRRVLRNDITHHLLAANTAQRNQQSKTEKKNETGEKFSQMNRKASSSPEGDGANAPGATPPPPTSPPPQAPVAEPKGGKKKNVRKECSNDECDKRVFIRGRCSKHIARKKCTAEDCETLAPPEGKGKCYAHRDQKRCKVGGCTAMVHAAGRKGKCIEHSVREKCKAEGCDTLAQLTGKGTCYKHSDRKQCRVDGCLSVSAAKGKCAKHNRTQCIHEDTDGRCADLAIRGRTKCSKHMPRVQCRHHHGNPPTQCRAAAILGKTVCSRHGQGKTTANAAEAAVPTPATTSEGKRAGTNSEGDDGGPPSGAERMEEKVPRPMKRKGTEGEDDEATSDRGGSNGTAGTGGRGTGDASASKVRRKTSLTFGDVNTALASVAKAAADRCLVETCPRAARGYYLCREHSGLYRCTARSAGGVRCSALTKSTMVGGTCAAHAKLGADEKMVKGGFTIFPDKSLNDDHNNRSDAVPVMKRQGVFNLVACSFSALGDTAVACNRNGYQASGDGGKLYCNKHRIFERLRATLATFERTGELDQGRLREVPKLADGTKPNWDAAVAEKLGLRPDGAIGWSQPRGKGGGGSG